MFILNVGDKKYKIQYKYRTLVGTDVIDKIVGIGEMIGEKNAAEMFKSVINTTAEMLLVGLQSNHSDEFGFDSDEERREKLLDVLDLMDEYEEANTDENGECQDGGYSLFMKLQQELERNNFLSSMTKGVRQAASDQNATVIPMDHQAKKSSKPGVKK